MSIILTEPSNPLLFFSIWTKFSVVPLIRPSSSSCEQVKSTSADDFHRGTLCFLSLLTIVAIANSNEASSMSPGQMSQYHRTKTKISVSSRLPFASFMLGPERR